MAAGRRRRLRQRAPLVCAAALAGGALVLHHGRHPSSSLRASPSPRAFVPNTGAHRGWQQPALPPADWLAIESDRLGSYILAQQPTVSQQLARTTAAAQVCWWRSIVSRLWSVTNGFSYVVCAMIGTSFALSAGRGGLAAAALGTPGGQAALVAASAGLTSFGGSTQSTLLRWLGQRAQTSAGVEVEPLRFSWQESWPHVWASLGVALAVGLHWTGRVLDGSWWRWAVAINSALFTVHAATCSGWFSNNSPRCPLLRALGTFLYLCGGSIWRDIMGATMPSALSLAYLGPAGLGVAFGLLLQGMGTCGKSAEREQSEGVPAAAISVPAVAYLFAACA